MSGADVPACQGCRSRHLGCDRQRPKCSRCLKDNVECIIREEVAVPPKKKARLAKTTKHQPDFPSGQPWITVKNSLVFVADDQSLSVEDRAASPPVVNSQAISNKRNPNSEEDNQETTPLLNQNNSHPTNRAVESPHSIPGISGDHDHTADEPFTETTNESRDGPSQSSPAISTGAVMDASLNSNCLDYSPLYDAETGLSGESALQTDQFRGTDITIPSPDSSRVFSAPSNPPSTGRLPAISISPEAVFSKPTTPLLIAHEAKLMQHFIEHLAPSIDICNQDQAFGRLVPRMAFLSPVLLTSIFAAAAKHMSKTVEPTDPTAEQYFQECLDHLIPMLNDPDAVVEDYLLAAVVILRVMEEMDIPLSGQDQQSHLPAIHALLSAQERYATSGGLRQAAFWVGFRQEMVVAFINQRPIVPVLEHCNIDRSFSEADEWTWTNRIIVHCADVINHCFKPSSMDHSTYQALREYGDGWMAHKPPYFTPIFQAQPSEGGTSFTKTWYAGETIAKGVQHYHLSRILLVAHDPTISRLGFQRRAFERTVDEKLRHHARILCGIAQGSGKTAAVWVTACLGISWCGDRFESRPEQEELLEILKHTERKHARHTMSTQKYLIQAWGWPEEETNDET